MGLMGLFGNNEVGLSFEKVDGIIKQCNADSQTVISTLGDHMQYVLNKLGEEWGTEESINLVENDIKKGLENASRGIANELKAIGNTIRETAMAQAADTNNDFSGLRTSDLAVTTTLVNKQQPQLASGYVGAVATLEKDVKGVTTTLESEVATKLNSLKGNLVEGARTAFLDEGRTVAAKADEYIENVKNNITSAIKTLLESVSTYTADVVKYEQSIQGEWKQVSAEDTTTSE